MVQKSFERWRYDLGVWWPCHVLVSSVLKILVLNIDAAQWSVFLPGSNLYSSAGLVYVGRVDQQTCTLLLVWFT